MRTRRSAMQTTKLRCSYGKLGHRLHEKLRILYYFPGDINNVFVERQFPCSYHGLGASLVALWKIIYKAGRNSCAVSAVRLR